MVAVLVDTNVLVYAEDRREPTKRMAAIWTLEHLEPTGLAVSSQILAEYASVLTRTSRLGLDPIIVAERVERVSADFVVMPVDVDTVVAALRAQHRWSLHYYDAQIWATAALNAVPVVLSEDFSDGMTLGSVRFVNPFAEDFDIGELL